MRKTLTVAAELAIRYLENLDSAPVAARANASTLRERLARPLGDAGIPPEQVVADLVRDVEDGILGSTSGRFFAWVLGGALPAALAADWLTSVWDQSSTLAASGPAAAVVEEIAGEWLKDVLNLPRGASFAFVSGCQMAHITCLTIARRALLTRAGWDVEQKGLSGAPAVRIIAGEQRHGSVDRAIRFVGFGTANVSLIPWEALEETLAADPNRPTIVVLQAGEINTGAFDSFETLIPLAKRYGAWVHVDGAFGLWAAASPKYRHLVRGVEAADSWATDGHKWLNVPFDCGYAFVADPAAHRDAVAYRAPYLTYDSDVRDAIDWTPEWSRRARAFPTYAALRQLGKQGITELVDRCCGYAHQLVEGIGALPGTEILWRPILNQGLIGFGDASTDGVIAAICQEGETYFWGTTWSGRRVMRVSVCNWRTTDRDVERAIASVARVLGGAA
ncbi:MAG TPA: pyridoxal-dependent decarboxylase [Bryobacteraceae bacterium]|nr:pyridoxal-dependent decarboxylase [Bryobacteraceae bacterium]